MRVRVPLLAPINQGIIVGAKTGLTFNALRTANSVRIGHFKNSKGEAAHSQPDGSDWNPADWLIALMGEIGEYARLRYLFDTGVITFVEYEIKAAKELADIQTYLDILAMRSLDRVPLADLANLASASQGIGLVIAHFGEYCNELKKLRRGDISKDQFISLTAANEMFLSASIGARMLKHTVEISDRRNNVCNPHPIGVNLGQATVDKFNEVSARVGSPVGFTDDGQFVYAHVKGDYNGQI